MKFILLSLILLISISVHAELEGDYSLISGPKECPSGSIQLKVDKKKKERILLFGSRHSWTLDMKDVSDSREEVEKGCTYLQKYKKTGKSFLSKTTRSKCPAKEENGIVIEKIIQQKNGEEQEMVYEFNFKKINFKCFYKKVIKS